MYGSTATSLWFKATARQLLFGVCTHLSSAECIQGSTMHHKIQHCEDCLPLRINLHLDRFSVTMVPFFQVSEIGAQSWQHFLSLRCHGVQFRSGTDHRQPRYTLRKNGEGLYVCVYVCVHIYIKIRKRTHSNVLKGGGSVAQVIGKLLHTFLHNDAPLILHGLSN